MGTTYQVLNKERCSQRTRHAHRVTSFVRSSLTTTDLSRKGVAISQHFLRGSHRLVVTHRSTAGQRRVGLTKPATALKTGATLTTNHSTAPPPLSRLQVLDWLLLLL